MQRCQFAGHVIGRALCLFCDPALPAFEGRGPIKTSLLDDLPRLDRGKATEHEAIPMGLLLFRARDKIKTGDGCWAESRSSIPGNRRGLLGCGVDFFIALLERQGSFSARTIRL